jgi:hypothetical protein
LVFCEKHKVSFDWLLCGDLKGLQRMMQPRRLGKAASALESLKAKIARLSESEREAVCKVMDQFLEQS